MKDWKNEPATITQKLAIRNALDKRYGMRQAREVYEELNVDTMTKSEASAELDRLYKKK